MIPDDSRRLFLKTAAAAAPLLAVATGTGGVGRAFADVIVERRPMPIPGLPQAIQNLRILHLSDIHLRQYVTLDTVEQIVTDAAALSPDLVLLTGDICRRSHAVAGGRLNSCAPCRLPWAPSPSSATTSISEGSNVSETSTPPRPYPC